MYRRSSSTADWLVPLGVFGAFVLVVAFMAYALVVIPNVKGSVTFAVQEKQRIAEDGDGKWMVFAKDGRTFQVSDNVFAGHMDSTDRYRKLVVNHRYRCTTRGIRSHMLSEYQNLINCTEVPS